MKSNARCTAKNGRHFPGSKASQECPAHGAAQKAGGGRPGASAGGPPSLAATVVPMEPNERISAAQNPDTHPDVLAELAHDDSEFAAAIREAVASNESTPLHILQHLRNLSELRFEAAVFQAKQTGFRRISEASGISPSNHAALDCLMRESPDDLSPQSAAVRRALEYFPDSA